MGTEMTNNPDQPEVHACVLFADIYDNELDMAMDDPAVKNFGRC